MVQLGVIAPRFAILDETDSGLDIDALRTVGEGINRIMRAPDKAVLLNTHYERLLEIVAPDFVHVLPATVIILVLALPLLNVLPNEQTSLTDKGFAVFDAGDAVGIFDGPGTDITP